MDDGKLWRAKEILSGRVGTFGYSPALYEQYGYVLLQMQDLPEAGRFLFLSGARCPEYELAISIFLQRYGRSGKSLAAAFPSSVRSLRLQDLPQLVAEELRARGVQEVRREGLPEQTGVRRRLFWKQRLALFGCIAALAFAAASALAGVPVIVRFVLSLIR
jgi:hypothetical protein